jgi:arabinogalactan endo-1,4-beta-galactosidase
MRKPIRSGVVLATALAMVATGIGLAAPASALYGDVEIDPIESNLAAKYWVNVSATGGGDTAGLAVDQNADTAWIAAPGESLTLDLGGAYDNARKVAVEFADPGAVYQYVVDASADGESWTTIADESSSTSAGAGAVHLITNPGMRYVKVTVLEASGDARIGISELEVYNYLRDEMVLGADHSWVDGDTREYWVSPLEEDRGAGPHLFDVVKDRGMEFVRLRIFNEPRSEGTGQLSAVPFQGPERSLAVAKQVAERDLQLGVDFHYADSWADPGKQPKPRAWAELPFNELTEAVHDYTYDYLQQLIAQGTTPDKVAVGNEILHGVMWGSEAQLSSDASAPVWSGANPAYFRNQPHIYQSQPGGGILWQYWNSDDPAERALYLESFDRFATLLASGIDAVRDASPTTKVELHSIVRREGYDGRPGLEMATEFWDQVLSRLEAQGMAPDYLAHSYYPEWHGSPEQLERNLQTISANHPEYKMTVAETSYPASGANGAPMPNSTYPRTVQGQADAIQRVFEIVNDIPNNRGSGVLTWEPQRWQAMFRSVPGLQNTSEPLASIDVYNKSAATHVLEDRVYIRAATGFEPALPETVHVLDVSSGAVSAAAVTWDLPSDLPTAGRTIVPGVTEFGAVAAIVDVTDDVTAPEVAASLTSDNLVVLEATDDLSGVAQIEYSTTKNKQSASEWTVYTGPFEVDAKSVVSVRAVDNAGNVSEVLEFTRKELR